MKYLFFETTAGWRICCTCNQKNIKAGDRVLSIQLGSWNSETSHIRSFCPECAKKHLSKEMRQLKSLLKELSCLKEVFSDEV